MKAYLSPMRYIQQGVLESAEERRKYRYAPRFAPAGQSTQMIVGATAETDKDILFLSIGSFISVLRCGASIIPDISR